MKKKNKKVYVALAVDFLHEGHLNILNKASKLGDVYIGLLTDEAIISYKNVSNLDFDKRKKLLKNFSFIKKIIPQESLDYSRNLNLIKPHYVVHGDDWRKGIQKSTRAKVIKLLKKWSGKLVEIKYTKDISIKKFKDKTFELGNNPNNRTSKLKRLLDAKTYIKILECHNPLSGLIVENISFQDKSGINSYDGMWSSSLTDSVSRGMPDNQSVDYSIRTQGVNAIMSVTTKPLIFDVDNGGQIEHLKFVVRDLERAGASAIVMEDKIGLKKNSLFKDQKGTKQDSIKNFAKKIRVAKYAANNKDFLVIARIESIILGKSINDALTRANAYSKAGADCILIHSKSDTPKEIFSFARKFKKSKYYKPLVCVPSTYSKVKERELVKEGFKIIIYANQLLRSAYKSMNMTATNILKNKRAFEVDKNITKIKEILTLIK